MVLQLHLKCVNHDLSKYNFKCPELTAVVSCLTICSTTCRHQHTNCILICLTDRLCTYILIGSPLVHFKNANNRFPDDVKYSLYSTVKESASLYVTMIKTNLKLSMFCAVNQVTIHIKQLHYN